MRWYLTSRARLGLALGASSLVSVGFWAAGAINNHSTEYAYYIWNLALAWIPLALALWLEKLLRVKLWSSWLPLVATALWLSFLPNSFYVISDFVHLTEVSRVDIVFDVAMLASFGINGLILGYVSLFIVHNELAKRLSARYSIVVIEIVLLLSSFAIYIGRDLRWNTWDVLAIPASLLFDVSDRILNASRNPQIFSTTLSFFVLLSSIYAVIYFAARALRQQRSS